MSGDVVITFHEPEFPEQGKKVEFWTKKDCSVPGYIGEYVEKYKGFVYGVSSHVIPRENVCAYRYICP